LIRKQIIYNSNNNHLKFDLTIYVKYIEFIIIKTGENVETVLTATYKNNTLVLDKELPLEQHSRIKITIDLPKSDIQYSFLEKASALDFEASPDWSVKVDEYLNE